MEEQKKNPELRFIGFSEDWSEHRLGDLIDITSAARVHKNEWTKSGVPFFRSSDVVSDYKGTDNTKAYISQELYNELSNKIGKVQKNDLLVTGGGSIGIPYLIKNNDPLYFKDADLLWLKNGDKINGQFLYEFFSTKTFRKYVEKITHIGTISHYTVEQAKDTPIALPCPDEQKRLGDFIAVVDKLLQTHQKKHNRLITLKKSMLEKMFPKEGQTVPEIRFKGFDRDWKPKRLDEITAYQNGKGYEGQLVTSGKYELVNLNSISIDGGLKPSNKFVDQADSILRKNDLVMILSDVGHGDLLGRVALIDKDDKYVLNQRVALLRPNEEINPKFLYYNINANQHYFKSQGAGMSQLNMSKGSVESFLSLVPTSESEQELIGCYFQNLDTLITSHKKQLQKLNNLKKSLTEKMFV